MVRIPKEIKQKNLHK